MKVVLVANDVQKKDFLSGPVTNGCSVDCTDDLFAVNDFGAADLLIDLLYSPEHSRDQALAVSGVPLIFINSVIPVTYKAGNWVRINGWTGFSGRTIIEGFCVDGEARERAAGLVSALGRTMVWVDSPCGFISARVIASIINEAFLALEEGIATSDDIDLAMKLGTNYPHGPLEWANLIGARPIIELLECLKDAEPDRHISRLLREKALAQ